MKSLDALVIGGGPAGTSASIRLARLGYSVCLTDAGAPDEFKVGESLPPAIKPLLSELGAHDVCEPAMAMPSYGNQSSWGDAILRDTDFINDPRGHGWHIDRTRFDAALRRISATAGVTMRCQTRLRSAVHQSDGPWRATLKSDTGKETVEARWIVDCGGRSSQFVRSQGVKRTAYDRLIAIVAEFASKDLDTRTLIESVADGWWYTSLVPRDRRIVVFHTDAATAACRMARTPAGFLSLLTSTRYIQDRLRSNAFDLTGPLRIVSANTACLERFSGPAWLAAGDAAMSFDPLSSQGIMTALYSGLKAADTIHDSLRGRSGAAERYEMTLLKVFQAYQRNWSLYYQDERRWPENPFWRRRRLSPRSDGEVVGQTIAFCRLPASPIKHLLDER